MVLLRGFWSHDNESFARNCQSRAVHVPSAVSGGPLSSHNYVLWRLSAELRRKVVSVTDSEPRLACNVLQSDAPTRTETRRTVQAVGEVHSLLCAPIVTIETYIVDKSACLLLCAASATARFQHFNVLRRWDAFFVLSALRSPFVSHQPAGRHNQAGALHCRWRAEEQYRAGRL